MSDKKVGAGLAALYRETDTPDTYGDAMELYDPLPGFGASSAEHGDTNTKSKYARTRAGITTLKALAFKVKTSEAEAANVIADQKIGTERKWQFAFPSEGPNAANDVETFTVSGWVKEYELLPSLEDETFLTFTLNVNDLIEA